jgi:hypothetical protein
MAVPGAGVKSKPIVSCKSISAEIGVVVDIFENKGTVLAGIIVNSYHVIYHNSIANTGLCSGYLPDFIPFFQVCDTH